jgi:hypothetical protein
LIYISRRNNPCRELLITLIITFDKIVKMLKDEA